MNPTPGVDTSKRARTSVGHALCLLLILLAGFGVRAAGVTWGRAYNCGSQGDSVEAYEVAVAYQAGDIRAQYLGQPNYNSITGAKLPGPVWTIFCVLGLKLGKSIEGVSWLLVLANVATILLIYLLAKQTLGSDAALAAAVLVAAAPPAIQFSFIIHNPALLPLLSTLLCLALWHVVQNASSRAILWVAFLLFLLPQVHLFGIFLIPATVLVIWLAGRPVNFLWLTVGLLAGAALYVPYLGAESGNDWENTRAILASSGAKYTPDALKAVSAPFSFLVNYWVPPRTYTPQEFREMCRYSLGGIGWVAAANVLATLFAIVLVVKFWHLARSEMQGFWKSPRTVFAGSPGLIFLVVLYVVPLAGALAAGIPFHARYALAIIGPLYAMAGAATVALLVDRRFRRAFAALGITVVVVNLWFVLATTHFLGRHIDHAPHFMGSFRKLESVYQSLRARAQEDQRIEISDKRYVPLPADEKYKFRDGFYLRPYVAIRERERELARPGRQKKPLIFEVFASGKAESDAGEVITSLNGIDLTLRQRP